MNWLQRFLSHPEHREEKPTPQTQSQPAPNPPADFLEGMVLPHEVYLH